MVEIELKFQLPEGKKKSVLQALKANTAQKIRLQAKYYDTPDRLLAQNHMAIRLRQEGDHWVQTFKASGKSHLERIENEVHLGQCKVEPKLNLDLFSENKIVKNLLNQVLGTQHDQLILQFKTDVQRTFRLLSFNETEIEVCLDDGTVSTAEQSEKICEVEFELKQGSPEQLIFFTQDWVKKYQLWLDVRSKAERGNLLSIHQKASPAVKAKTLILNKNDSTDVAIRKMIGNALQQLLPNAAVIADNVANPEHIHQARVAIRRIRSIFKSFKSWSDDIDPQWEKQLAQIFQALGTTRDLDVIRDEIFPELLKADAPFSALPESATIDDQTHLLFQKAETVCLLLQLLAFSYHEQSHQKESSKLKKKIKNSLNHLHKKIIQDADHFTQLEIEERHRTRKQCKRLRYCIEFVASLYDEKSVKKYLNQLQVVQEKLGFYNDLHITERVFIESAQAQPEFWFAVGWSKAKQEQLLLESEQELIKFADIEVFW
ncbi:MULTISPECIES: CYTH and CHAD domain-containing protein [unclassified Acinetobacter]|uniref:CYTH and CHAD domain-containing protein n=1 Tax=unclassified Acinetobacter TaxID=196816 RepID=UPI00190E131F|nr:MULTISPECIES: CYTH and CHAD domain-containing protein [unclassified Acinetobacter]MBK0063872.1 CHAD domain-containing protein [Acinetobacter sp. S55]MBK0067060.1 CHAD domain-containing protein [Acinetobacter sp. S54]